MAHLFIVVVYDSFNRKNVKISTTYYFLDFSFFMSQDDAHYQNHLNAPKFSTSCRASHCLVVVIENEKKLKLKINQSSTSNGLALPGEGAQKRSHGKTGSRLQLQWI